MKRASPTHGGRWLAQTNYDALLTPHTTENRRIRNSAIEPWELSSVWGVPPGGGGGGVLPIWWVIHNMCRGFDPLFWPSGYQPLSFGGVFFSSTNTKTIFWVQILTKFDLFGPKIPFSPRSFWVQFSVAHGTPPAIFGPSTPPHPPTPPGACLLVPVNMTPYGDKFTTVAQIMACHLTALNPLQNQCRLKL